jgi:hypothetical protein
LYRRAVTGCCLLTTWLLTFSMLCYLKPLPLPTAFVLQGRCRLLLVDNIAAHLWHDRGAAVPSSGHNTSSSLQAPPPHYASNFQGPAAAAAAAVPGLSAQRVQGAVAALLLELSQSLRFPVVVSKQAGVSLEERHEGARLVQRELLSVPWQVRLVSCSTCLHLLCNGEGVWQRRQVMIWESGMKAHGWFSGSCCRCLGRYA